MSFARVQIPEFDNLYLDMNGIIHNCSHPNDDDVHFRISEQQIFQDIFRYVEFLFRMIKPRKVFFMAIDGVAPRAKMNQQRGRRFRSAKEAENKEQAALAKGEVLPKEKRFDSNCITPGTEFMDRLHQQLKYFVVYKISTDEMWRGVKVYLSGHETPGEGEHKIMDFIRYSRSQPDYDPNTRHCLYGLDADLIMLGMCSHEPHFSLLREEVKFLRTKTVKKVTTRSVNPDVITFYLLHLSLLRDYLDHEFEELKALPFYNLEHIIDDWILMSFLVGNDFIPHIPHFHINKNSLTSLYRCYMDVLPTLGGYINEDGNLNLQRFEAFLKKVADIDVENFTEVYADLKYFGAKTDKAALKEANSRPLESFFGEINISAIESDAHEPLEPGCSANGHSFYEAETPSSDSSEAEDTFDEEFRLHKKLYYESKLEYANADSAVLKEQALCYVRAIQWNLHYYYNGCVSWSWYYPHHYAPYISDVTNFSDADLKYDLGKPFKPFEQLLGVLPAASKDLLPRAYQRLVTDQRSPLIDFYPDKFDLDMNEKQQEWEAVVKIPFIDEERLVKAAEESNMLLSAQERQRNCHGPHLLFTYTPERQPPYPTSLPGTAFTDVAINHAHLEELDSDHFRIPKEQVVHGLSKGCRTDVQFPGFPTLKFVEHEAKLKEDKIRVFEMPSRGVNMTLRITDDKSDEDAEAFARQYLNHSVLVNWPHLIEAKVVTVYDCDGFKYYFDRGGQFVKEKIEDREIKDGSSKLEHVKSAYRERRGIYIGDSTKIIVSALPITGREYIPSASGVLTLEKQWAKMPMICPLQTVVKNIAVYDPAGVQKFKSVEDIYPVGAKCFALTPLFYGCPAEVIEKPLPDGTIKVKIVSTKEPDISEIIERKDEILDQEYHPNYVVAQRLGISGHMLARLTGTIFLKSHGGQRCNIGLNLRLNQRNLEIPGYSRKRDRDWLFSRKLDEIVNEYQEKFPEVFEALSKSGDRDSYDAAEMFGKEKWPQRLSELQGWLRSMPTHGADRQKIGAEVLDECIVKWIENTVDTHHGLFGEEKTVSLSLKPHLLYRPLHFLGFTLPDKDAKFNLFDRVVNVKDGISVPLGAKGHIVGIHIDDEREVNTVYDVLFDEAFPGGTQLRCSPGRGYKMSPAALINISYGQLKQAGKNPLFAGKNTNHLLQKPRQQHYQQHANGSANGSGAGGGNSSNSTSRGHANNLNRVVRRTPRNQEQKTNELGKNLSNGMPQNANGVKILQRPKDNQQTPNKAQTSSKSQPGQHGSLPTKNQPPTPRYATTAAAASASRPAPTDNMNAIDMLFQKAAQTPKAAQTTNKAANTPQSAQRRGPPPRNQPPPPRHQPIGPVATAPLPEVMNEIDKLFYKPKPVTPTAQQTGTAARLPTVPPQAPPPTLSNDIEQLFAKARRQ